MLGYLQTVDDVSRHVSPGAGQRSRLYYVENPQDQVYAVLAPYDPAYKRADLVIMARIVGDQVIIDIDKTSKPLYEALTSVGISVSQIVQAGAEK